MNQRENFHSRPIQQFGLSDGAKRLQERKKLAGFKPKSKQWTHQDDLAAARGKKIIVVSEKWTFEGVLLESDAFTLKMQIENCSFPRILFKSSLTYFALAE